MEQDEIKSKHFAHLCLQLDKLVAGSDQPLDHLVLCYTDLLVMFKRFEEAKALLFSHYERHPNDPNAIVYILKFNELHLKDAELFRTFYNRLLDLDRGHRCLIDYLDYLCVPVEILKVLLSFVDYNANKDDLAAWRQIYTRLVSIERSSPKAAAIREFYHASGFASYWPTYQFINVSLRINAENCDFLFHKAFVFNYFQAELSTNFAAQVKLILTITKCDKLELIEKFEF